MKEIKITPKSGSKIIDFAELRQYRELFYIFVWRDIKIRYKQTAFGIIWVIFQPLINTLIFTILFGKLAKIPSGEIPYSLFVFSGLIFWTFFTSALTHTSDSLVQNEPLIKKIYFPKIILPISSILTTLVDFSINFIIIIIYALCLGFIPRMSIFYILPFCVLITFLTSMGVGLLLSSVNVRYRDIRYILPFFIQLLLYVTPIIYPLSILSPRNRIIMGINPITSVVELFRTVFSPNHLIPTEVLLISIVVSFSLFIIGFLYFNKTEKYIADII